MGFNVFSQEHKDRVAALRTSVAPTKLIRIGLFETQAAEPVTILGEFEGNPQFYMVIGTDLVYIKKDDTRASSLLFKDDSNNVLSVETLGITDTEEEIITDIVYGSEGLI